MHSYGQKTNMSSDLHSLYITVPMFINRYMKRCINVAIENEWHDYKIWNILKILNQKKRPLNTQKAAASDIMFFQNVSPVPASPCKKTQQQSSACKKVSQSPASLGILRKMSQTHRAWLSQSLSNTVNTKPFKL